MVTTSGNGLGWPNAADQANALHAAGGNPGIWQQDQPAASIPLGGQLGGRPYVGPPTEPSRTIPGPPVTDRVAVAYHGYSQAVTMACQRFRSTQDAAWQEYTRMMQDANAAYEVEVRRASLTLDGSLAAIRIG